MDVTCTLFGPLRDATGDDEVTLTVPEEATILDVLETLCDDYPGLQGQLLTEDRTIQDGIVITLNKRHVSQLEGPATEVPAGATVRIAPSLQGG